MDVMHPYRHSEVIPEVKGVQAFPPVFFNNNPMKRKEKIMGLDIYLSKKIFIGAMYISRGITGSVSLFSRGKKIPVRLERLAYVIEDIYHGRKTHWLLHWLEIELPESLGNAEEQEISVSLMDRLHQACVEVLVHRKMTDFREVCKEKLYCSLKPDISEDDLNCFLDEVDELAKATDSSEKTDDAVFIVSASW